MRKIRRFSPGYALLSNILYETEEYNGDWYDCWVFWIEKDS